MSNRIIINEKLIYKLIEMKTINLILNTDYFKGASHSPQRSRTSGSYAIGLSKYYSAL